VSSVTPDGATVVIASRLFPPEPGAAAFRLGWLARTLARRGVRVEVLTTRPPKVAARATPWDDGVVVRRWPVLRDAGGNVRGYVPFASFDLPLLGRLLVSRPDVVVVEPPPTTGFVVRLVCTVKRVPYVYYAADVSSTAAAGIGVSPGVVRVLRAVESWVMRGAAHVLTVSDGVAREVAALGVDPGRVSVVGTGVDTETFVPAAEPDDGTPTLVYAGTMSEVHGAEVFVRAFAAVSEGLPRARLVMLGQGTERDTLQRIADDLVPGRVTFEGLVGADRVAEAMGSAWVGLASVRPGRGYDFSFPTKMFVSTACGTPVIYSGVGPGRDVVVDHDLGWATDWQVDEVAAAMRAALAQAPDPGRRARVAAWTREHASQSSVSAKAADAVLAAVPR
jgi:glycosyltransferase involved in cell wall biosynthesis